MPTNDERLVAACHIRDIRRKIITTDSRLVAELKGALGTTRVRTLCPTSYMLAEENDDFLSRLADLIEPDLIEELDRGTCRDLQYLWYDFTCSECGFQLGYTDGEFAYCPMCGARVLEEDSDDR